MVLLPILNRIAHQIKSNSVDKDVVRDLYSHYAYIIGPRRPAGFVSLSLRKTQTSSIGWGFPASAPTHL